MQITKTLTGSALLLALALGATSAQAAPAASGLGGLDTATESAVEKTYWATRCNWHRGRRHCTKVWVPTHRRHWNRRWW